MSTLRRRDNTPERLLRSALHGRGLRFRVERPVPGLPRRRVDILFGPARVAVFVDGCFWHGCPEHCVMPKANADWWRQKIEGNRGRDRETDSHLRTAGFAVVRVWEHEDPEVAADAIEELVRDRAGGHGR